jgi:hypothetical protein
MSESNLAMRPKAASLEAAAGVEEAVAEQIVS